MNQIKYEIIKSICGMCAGECGIDVHVKDGKVINITGMPEHYAKNLICEKGRAAVERNYLPDRLTHPLKKVNGKFERISWDEALDFIAIKLTGVKEKYGPWALATHTGMVLRGIMETQKRFCSAFGSPNYCTNAYLCHGSRVAAQELTVGYHMPPNFKGTKCTLLWGHNPINSGALAWEHMKLMQKRGAKLIVVDPRRTTTAKAADIYAQIRPGTDGALGMSMIDVIISEELYDKEFVRDWTYGFDKLAARAEGYSPEKVEEITWISAETIRQMARMYATNKPACTFAGTIVEHNPNSFQGERVIAALATICGNIDTPGSNKYDPKWPFKEMTVFDNCRGVRPLGAWEYPAFHNYYSDLHEAHFCNVVDAMLTGKPYPIKALILQGINSAITHPNTNRFKEAVKKLDLLVDMDMWMTETAELSDIVLPAATFLEKKELRCHLAMPLVTLCNKAVEPPGECWPDYKFWRELAKRVGLERYFPWEDEEDEFRVLLEPTGITLEQLKENPGGVWLFKKRDRNYLQEGFKTPSGKVELYSQRLAFWGLDPLPGYFEPPTTPVSRPDLAKEYPLILTTGARIRYFMHSQYRNIPSLRKRYPGPLIEINTATAEQLGIGKGDVVEVTTPIGSIRLKADVTPDIHPQVVQISHGWGGEANVNILLDDQKRDPFSGYAEQNAALCRVDKI